MALATLVPFNWRHVTSKYMPPSYALDAEGRRRKLAQTDVLLRIDPCGDIRELRDWLYEHARGRYKMYGAFTVRHRQWTIERVYNGIVFSFDDIADAVHFKLRWFCNDEITLTE